MKKIILITFISLLIFTSISYSQTYAIKIDKFSISPDLRVEFTKYNIAVDETWRIVGSCKNAINPTRVEIVEFGIGSNIRRVEITNSVIADRDICIVNPEDLPKSVLEMLR
jgi:hypothetical protein